jgi:hypothetical protein
MDKNVFALPNLSQDATSQETGVAYEQFLSANLAWLFMPVSKISPKKFC